MGLPEGAIRQKMQMDGVMLDILGYVAITWCAHWWHLTLFSFRRMDPEGPSPNAVISHAPSSLNAEQALPAPSSLRSLPNPQYKKYDSDDDFDSD